MGTQFAVNALKTAGSVAFTAGVSIAAVQGLSKVAVVAKRGIYETLRLLRLDTSVDGSYAHSAATTVSAYIPVSVSDFFKRDFFTYQTAYNRYVEEKVQVQKKDATTGELQFSDLEKKKPTMEDKRIQVRDFGNIALAASGLAVTALALLVLESKFSSFNVLSTVLGSNWTNNLPRFGL